MGVTNFPNGINAGNSAGASADLQIGGTAVYPLSYGAAPGTKTAAGTVVVPSGASGTAFASGLTTVSFVLATPYSTVATVAGYAGVVASATGGSVTLIGISGAGTVSTANGTATWLAIGT